MTSVTQELDSMLTTLPKLNTSCKEFSSKAQEITNRRLKNKNTLHHHPELLELLEIPQLMDTCVRNQFYEEALELEAYTQKLKRLHPDVSVIQNIVSSLWSEWQSGGWSSQLHGRNAFSTSSTIAFEHSTSCLFANHWLSQTVGSLHWTRTSIEFSSKSRPLASRSLGRHSNEQSLHLCNSSIQIFSSLAQQTYRLQSNAFVWYCHTI